MNLNDCYFVLYQMIPIIGVIVAILIWANSKFNVKSICVQLTVICYMFGFCILYLLDNGQLLVDRVLIELIIRLLQLIGIICTGTHIYYLTRQLNEVKRNKEKHNNVSATA